MTLRTLLILINIAAVITMVVIIGAKVLSVRREPAERTAANQTPFYDDDVLEDAHLTRVLRWALIFSTIVAVVLPLYWLLARGGILPALTIGVTLLIVLISTFVQAIVWALFKFR